MGEPPDPSPEWVIEETEVELWYGAEEGKKGEPVAVGSVAEPLKVIGSAGALALPVE